jgi:hypothetical protein
MDEHDRFRQYIIGLIGVVISVSIWIKVRQIGSHDNKRRKALTVSEGKTAVLILDIPVNTNHTIINSVTDYLKQDTSIPQLSEKTNLFHIRYLPEDTKHDLGSYRVALMNGQEALK